jgi:hypothetical protein
MFQGSFSVCLRFSKQVNNNFYTIKLAPWVTVLPKKLTGLQLVKDITTFYRTQKFITVLTEAHHLSLF